MPKYTKNVEIAGRGADEIFQEISSGIDRFLSKTAITGYKIERSAETRRVRVESSMFSATLVCSDGRVELDADLSWMAMPFKSKIDAGIDRWLAKAFGTKA